MSTPTHHCAHTCKGLCTALDRATERAPALHWIWDSVHPTYSGHQILADEWERAVRAAWSAKKR